MSRLSYLLHSIDVLVAVLASVLLWKGTVSPASRLECFHALTCRFLTTVVLAGENWMWTSTRSVSAIPAPSRNEKSPVAVPEHQASETTTGLLVECSGSD